MSDLSDFQSFLDSDSPNDSADFAQVYTAFVGRAQLEEEDREKLKKERGFNDDIIKKCAFKSCCPGNADIIKDLEKQFGRDLLIESGLLEASERGIVPAKQLLGSYNKKTNKWGNNILIPYFDAAGSIFFIRPHCFGLKDKGINIYAPVRNLSTGGSRDWIIAESEFKAAAAIQLGFPAFGLPGIHSFAVNNFGRLQSFIESLNIGRIVIIYDNEIKNDPKFSNFKKDPLKQWDTQWRSIELARNLQKAIPSLQSVKIGLLPESWMVDGKIDIDGALAMGKTHEQMQGVIYNAMTWEHYKEILPPVAKQIINRKIYKEEYQESSKIKKRDNRYFVIKEKKIRGQDIPLTYEEPISNFTMQIQKTLIDNSENIREIIFYGADGSVSKAHQAKKGTNNLKEFKSWAFVCGRYTFTGSQEDLDRVLELEDALCDGREIERPAKIGLLDNDTNLWLFGNCIIKHGGEILYPDKEGVVWDGLTGYLPRSIKANIKNQKSTGKNQMPIVNTDIENETFGLQELRSVAEDMESIFQTKATNLAIGWCIAALLSNEIFEQFSCFPILFISGRRETGKTTLGNWLMALTGQPDTATAGHSMDGTTPPGAERCLAWYSCLTYWLDEYRTASSKKWEGVFRNIYGRQASSKGTTGDRTQSHDINAALLLSGEETPNDNALLSRCVVIPLKTIDKMETRELFNKIEGLRSRNLLSRLIIEVLRRKESLISEIKTNITGWKKVLSNRGVKDRISLNYSIPAVCFDALFLKGQSPVKRKEFADWVVSESYRAEQEKESEHMLSIFLESFTYLGDSENIRSKYKVLTRTAKEEEKNEKGRLRIAFHYPSFYAEWAKEYKRLGHEPFKSATLRAYLKEEFYFIEEKNVRFGSKVIRCMHFSLDPEDNPHPGLLYLAGGECVEGESDEIDVTQDGVSEVETFLGSDI